MFASQRDDEDVQTGEAVEKRFLRAVLRHEQLERSEAGAVEKKMFRLQVLINVTSSFERSFDERRKICVGDEVRFADFIHHQLAVVVKLKEPERQQPVAVSWRERLTKLEGAHRRTVMWRGSSAGSASTSRRSSKSPSQNACATISSRM